MIVNDSNRPDFIASNPGHGVVLIKMQRLEGADGEDSPYNESIKMFALWRMKAIITVDIGTTSTRAILYDDAGQVRYMDQRDNGPTSFEDGRVEQDPLTWHSVLRSVLKNCAEVATSKGFTPTCIAVTAQRSSLIAVDRLGAALHPAIMWQDLRSAALAQAMRADDALVYGKTGLKISPVFSAIKMTWLRRTRPELWAKTHKLLGVQDWVLYLLTGRFVTDHTFASRTNLLDLQSRAWDPDLLALFQVEPALLCELLAPGSVVGGLTPELGRLTGLTAGLPVVSAGGDQQCAALGLGLFSGERAVANTGTGSYLIGHSQRPVFDAQMRMSCNVSAVPDAYIVEAAVLTSGSVYHWFTQSLLGAKDATQDPFETLNAEAARVPPGANGLLMLPHFKGCGSPYWDPQAKGVFFNLSLTTTRGDMARAILESIALELTANLQLVEQLCGPVKAVSVGGGMTKLDLFNQIQSDVFERPVQRFPSAEATSLGAWMAGAVAVGLATSYATAFERATGLGSSVTFRPNAANRDVYARQGRQSRALYQALSGTAFRTSMQ